LRWPTAPCSTATVPSSTRSGRSARADRPDLGSDISPVRRSSPPALPARPTSGPSGPSGPSDRTSPSRLLGQDAEHRLADQLVGERIVAGVEAAAADVAVQA